MLFFQGKHIFNKKTLCDQASRVNCCEACQILDTQIYNQLFDFPSALQTLNLTGAYASGFVAGDRKSIYWNPFYFIEAFTKDAAMQSPQDESYRPRLEWSKNSLKIARYTPVSLILF